jgi:hypothetical protein
MSSEGNRMAGAGLINWLLTDPLGEEIGEGVVGGLLAGLPGLAADQSLGQTALQTASAIAGGIGFGMVGRKVGAWAGDKLHEGALKDQGSMVATLARTLGSETTAEGMGDQLRQVKGVIEESLIQDRSAQMAREAAADPGAFAAKHGITAEMFNRMRPSVENGRVVHQALKMAEGLDPDTRQRFLDQLLKEYEPVENAISKAAAGSIDEGLGRASKEWKKTSIQDPEGAQKFKQMFGTDPAEMMESLRGKAKPVTGRHVGRAVGRLLGDEIGVLGGLAAGSALASAMGMQSPKDRRIEELERQLRQQGA